MPTITIDDKRAAWGAAPPNGTIHTVPLAEKDCLLGHYVDGTPLGLADNPHSDCLAKVKQFQAFHMGPSRGWNDIGYNALICQHGRLIEGRGLLTVGAQCPGYNFRGIGVQFMVGGSERPTDVAYARFAKLRAELTAARGVAQRLMGHRDGIATSCPGDVIYAWLKAGAVSPIPPTGNASSIPPVLTNPPKPAPAPAYPGVQTRRGQKNSRVLTIQKQLKARGWTIATDSSFGPATERVVKRFQQNKGLKVDGIVGPQTWVALWALPVT